MSPIEIHANRTVECLICHETWESLLEAIAHPHFQPEDE
jgi:hypothetical protein